MAKSFQEFRCKGEVIRIETITDSDGQQCVLWRDIRTAFPGMTRIQHGNMFVPIVKDNRFYRKKPHRILYHPDVVLDVIYMPDSPRTRSMGEVSDTGGTPVTTVPEQTLPVAGSNSSSASSPSGGAASVSLWQNQTPTKHEAKPWFSGLMQTLSTKPKGSSTVGMPPFVSLSSTSLANLNASYGSLSKPKSQLSQLSIVPSSASSSSADS